MPRSFATLAVSDRLPTGHMHRDKFPDACANMSPALPVTTANASAPSLLQEKPPSLFQAYEQFQLRGKCKVPHPSSHIVREFSQPMIHRDSAAAPGDLTDTMLETMDGLLRHVDRRSAVYRLDAYPYIRRVPSYARSTSRSCLHLVLVPLKWSFGILIS
jgi:hypothetical protein